MPSTNASKDDKDLFEQGLALYSKRKYTEALPYFQQLTDSNFTILKYYHLGLTYIQLGEFKKGLDHYRKIHEVPSNVHGIEYDRIMYGLYINMGSTLQVLARQKKKPELFDEAITCYTYALQIQKNDARVWNNLGNAHLDLAHHQEAIASFQKAIALDDEYPEAHYSLSLVYESLKKYEKAIEQLKLGLKWKARNKTFLNRIAGLTFGLGNFKEAQEYALRAWHVNPEDITANKNLALIHYNLQEYDEAYRYYQKLMQINPKFSDPLVDELFEDLQKKLGL